MFHADVNMQKMAVMSIQFRGRTVPQECLSFSLPFTHATFSGCIPFCTQAPILMLTLWKVTGVRNTSSIYYLQWTFCNSCHLHQTYKVTKNHFSTTEDRQKHLTSVEHICGFWCKFSSSRRLFYDNVITFVSVCTLLPAGQFWCYINFILWAA